MPATDYSIHPDVAMVLSALAELPAEARAQGLRVIGAKIGAAEFVRLFAEFIGLANSVADSAREMVELVLVTEGSLHPHCAEKTNLPTVPGALQGVRLAADVDQSRLCHGCAFRLGSPANHSPSTTLDAEACTTPGEEPFYCHAEMDGQGHPIKACAGFAQVRARRNAEARAHG